MKITRVFRLKVKILFYRYLYWRGGIEMVSNRLRRSINPAPILKYFGASIGEGTKVYPGIVIHGAVKDFSNLKVGKHCRIMRDCIIDLTDKVELEDYCGIGWRNILVTHMRLLPGSPLRDSDIYEAMLKDASAPIKFQEGALTFTNVTILYGVTLGKTSVVGANSVINKDTPDFSITWGNPSKTTKFRPVESKSDSSSKSA